MSTIRDTAVFYLSAAAGLAAARDIKGEDHEVIAVIGDGSLTGGHGLRRTQQHRRQ